MLRQLLTSTLFPYTTLFRSEVHRPQAYKHVGGILPLARISEHRRFRDSRLLGHVRQAGKRAMRRRSAEPACLDRKSTRLNSSHSQISYAVFCLKKKSKANDE